MPVMTNAAYNPPYKRPPSAANCWNTVTSPDVNTFPIANVTGPMTINDKNPMSSNVIGATTNS